MDFVTLFPQMVLAASGHSILGRAQAAGHVAFRAFNPRDYAYDRHRKVDEAPYGGGPGMLLKAEPVALALEALQPVEGAAVVLTDPSGSLFDQAAARELSERPQVVFLCGHYEGFDHRVRTRLATHVLSIGDYVLTNGELPALVMADAVTRLLPGVLGNEGSLEVDSHSGEGLLGAPNFTRPEVWRGERVPDVLLSGDHQAIARWRHEQALRLTQELRPELMKHSGLDVLDSTER